MDIDGPGGMRSGRRWPASSVATRTSPCWPRTHCWPGSTTGSSGAAGIAHRGAAVPDRPARCDRGAAVHHLRGVPARARGPARAVPRLRPDRERQPGQRVRHRRVPGTQHAAWRLHDRRRRDRYSGRAVGRLAGTGNHGHQARRPGPGSWCRRHWRCSTPTSSRSSSSTRCWPGSAGRRRAERRADRQPSCAPIQVSPRCLTGRPAGVLQGLRRRRDRRRARPRPRHAELQRPAAGVRARAEDRPSGDHRRGDRVVPGRPGAHPGRRARRPGQPRLRAAA